MKTQHTPGPWARNISPAWKYPIYDENNHNKIAYIIRDACITEAEQEANLNLIATAPELLECLQETLSELQAVFTWQIENKRISEVVATQRISTINKAGAAIAKAKGE